MTECQRWEARRHLNNVNDEIDRIADTRSKCNAPDWREYRLQELRAESIRLYEELTQGMQQKETPAGRRAQSRRQGNNLQTN